MTAIRQDNAEGSMISPSWSLIPPGSDDFALYGGADTVARAREWAFRHQYLLYRGPAQSCVHGLYRMDSCASEACRSAGLDHTRIWVQHDARGAFILTHPYVQEIPDELHAYGRMHGLRVESHRFDGWYRDSALPVRLSIPENWPLWPIERDAVLLLHTQPVRWPEDDE